MLNVYLHSSNVLSKSTPTHPECSCSELLSRPQNSKTSLLFSSVCTGLKFLNELNIRLSLSPTKSLIPLNHHISMTSYLFSLLMVTMHNLYLTSLWYNYRIVIIQNRPSIVPTCFTSSLESASYITQNSSSKLFIPLSASFIWTCRFCNIM